MNGYHALSYGWLAGEVVRRVSGQSLGTFFKENVAEKLGVDVHIGLPSSEDHRVMPMQPMEMPEAFREMMKPPDPSLPLEQKELKEANHSAFSNPEPLRDEDGTA